MAFGLKNKQRVDPSEQAQVYDELRKSKREDFYKNIDKNKEDFYNHTSNTSGYIKNPYQASQNQERDLKGQVDEQIRRQRMESSRVDNPNNPYELSKRQEKSIDPYEKAKAQSSQKFGAKLEGGGSKSSGVLPDSLKEYKNTVGGLFKQAKAQKRKSNALGAMASQAIAEGESAISRATSNLLQQAWKNAIDSYGLTILLYVNFHVFCRFVFGPKIFCKLGREWGVGKMGGGAVGKAAPSMGSKGGGITSKAGSSNMPSCLMGIPFAALGLVEAAILAIVDLIVLFSIIQQLALWVMIILIMTGDTSIAWDVLGEVWALFKTFVGL